MLTSILTLFRGHPALPVLSNALDHERHAAVHGLGASSAALLAAVLAGAGDDGKQTDAAGFHPGRLLVVLPEADEAEAFRDDLESILGAERVRLFPERDTSPYEHIDSHAEVRSQRVEVIDLLARGWRGAVVASIGAVHDPTMPPGLIDLVTFSVTTGKRVDFDDFIRSLVMRGFKRVGAVTEAGQLSVRGGIVDVYPFGGDTPYRMEFWGDEIESIRTFSTATQRSTGKVSGFRIIPPDEFIPEAGLGAAERERLESVERDAGIDLSSLREAFEGEWFDGAEQYLHVLYGDEAIITAHFGPEDTVLVVDPGRCRHQLESRRSWTETIWSRQHDDDPDLAPPSRFIMPPESVMEHFDRLRRVNEYAIKPPDEAVIEFSVKSSRQYQGNLAEVITDIRDARAKGMSCHILCDNRGQVERLEDLLDEVEGEYAIDVARLSGGFTDESTGLMVLTDHEIFSRYRRRVRYRKFKDGMPIPDFRALTIGDYVVHVDYGIGRFTGMKRTRIAGAETDCLVIRYRDNDQLLLPVGQLKRLKKFTSEEGVTPVVSKLGGTAWEKLKARTKSSIQRMAKDLLRLYARRKAFTGHAFKADDRMMKAFEDSFVYEETPDQQRAWEEVRADMERPAPMERLICGDVGFGKTEIAIRAAFLAVLDGKQVAVLVPTTILAEQHEETFYDRFADFPVKLESLSRFKTRAEQKRLLDRLARGDIDIIIGTQRLLSKDVHFKDLGLLVIDEEQRFGVKHKERLKAMRSNVDVLAMSATPIPRTLNMSLLGARDISYINTPPRDRYSVHTEIVPFDEKFITEAILREIDREGQVFFVHNRVKSIYSIEHYLRRLLPSVTFGVGHGQLPERELERVMHDFHHRKFQVLIATMIIENGLDIPSVNTILINRADTFGLAHLYQLRGRVGRADRRAFAYLLIPPRTALSRVAHNRLRTIEEFADLGSGFNIAMRDLEIRGAGNILGTEQTGFISSLGFDMYMDLLKETIAELKGEKIEKPPDVEIRTPHDMFLPDDYIPSAEERVLFYRRIADSVNSGQVDEIGDELADRYGRLPVEARNLLAAAYLRHYADSLGATEVTVGEDGAVIVIIPETIELTRGKVEEMVRKSPAALEFSFREGMQVGFSIDRTGNALDEAKKVLQVITT